MSLSPVTPSQDQIETILVPWRTIFQRDIAHNPGALGCVWLRTDYLEGTDAAHESLLEHVDWCNAVDDEDRLLDDEDLYNFGDDWRRILDVFPELVSYSDEIWTSQQKSLQEAEDYLLNAKAYLAGREVEDSPIEWIDSIKEHCPATEAEQIVMGTYRSGVHMECVANYLIVEDKKAVETKQLLLVFLDAFGRVVRWSRVDPSEAEQMGGSWLAPNWFDLHEWKDGEIGEDYQVGGVCGHLLHM